MAIIDPFDSPGAPDATPKGIVDPFEQPMGASETLSGAASRLLPSIGEQIGGVFHQIAHPIETATDAYHLVKGLSTELEDKYREKMGLPALPPVAAQQTSKAFRDYYKENYGSLEGFKQHLAQDPGAVLGDMSMLFSGGSSAFARLPALARTAEIAARVTNPLSAVTEPAALAGRAIGQIPRPFARPTGDVAEALQRTEQAGMPVNVPRGITSPYQPVQAGTVALARTPVAGTPLLQAGQAVPAQIGGHIEGIAGQFAPEMPPNIVGGGIEQTLSGAAQRERAAAEAQAQARQTQIETAAQQQFGNVHPNQMAENTNRAVQESHDLTEAGTQVNWSDVNNLNAHAEKRVFDDLHNEVERGLSAEGVTLDPVRTPNAWSMMQEARRLSGEAPHGEAAGIPPRMMQALEASYGKGQVPAHVLESLVPGSTTGMVAGKDPQFRLLGQHAPEPGSPIVSVQGLDELRRRVGRMAYNATTPEDRWASNAVKSQFGDFLNNTLENHLAPGSDPNAKAVIQKAVDSTRAFKERFGYNTKNLRGEDKIAARDLNLMATGNIGPEAVAQKLVGAGKPGTRPGSSPLHDAVMNAVENPAAVRADMRGAYWNALTEGKTPRAIASNVKELPETRMGKTLFEPHEHDLMGRYADVQQQAAETIKPGKSEQIAGEMLGRNRGDEQILGTLEQAFKTDGNIKQAARTWGQMSDANRNEFRGAWLRQLGGGGENFSLAKFVTNWDKYSDQAKAILLRDRAHRQNLQDFYTIAKQYKDAVAKYGNPSGTAQVTFWHRLAEGAVKGVGALAVGHFVGAGALAGTLAAGLGLRGVAKFLSTSQGAAQIGRWTRLAKAYQAVPNASTLNALQSATRSLNEQK